jgi:hypothetical protein
LFQCNRSAARERRRNLISGQEQRSSPHGIARQSCLGRTAGSAVILPQWRFANSSPPRGSGVAPALNQHVEDLTLVVDGTPEAHPLAGDPDHDLAQMPSVSRPMTTPS